MKAHRESSYSSILSLTSALDVGGWCHVLAAVRLGKGLSTYCKEGWVGPTAGLERCKKPCFPLEFDPQAVQPVAHSYRNYIISTHSETKKNPQIVEHTIDKMPLTLTNQPALYLWPTKNYMSLEAAHSEPSRQSSGCHVTLTLYFTLTSQFPSLQYKIYYF